MKFPTSRTEIMDNVAMTVSSATLSGQDIEKNVKLALIHWNHVDDKSLPDIKFEGFDYETTSPVKTTNIAHLKQGAGDYLSDRADVLNDKLELVVRSIYATHESNIKNFGDNEGAIFIMNDLLSEKAQIVEQLEAVGHTTMNRKIDFEFDDESIYIQLDDNEIKSFIQNELSFLVTGFDAHTDIDVHIGNEAGDNTQGRAVSVSISAPESMVKDIVSNMKEIVKSNDLVFKNILNLQDGPSVSISAQEPEIKGSDDVARQIAKLHEHEKQVKQQDDLSSSLTM